MKRPPANSAHAQLEQLLERSDKMSCMAQALDYLADTCDEIAGVKDIVGALALHANIIKKGLQTALAALAAESQA